MSIRLVSRRGAIGKSWHAVALRDAAERLLGVGRSGSGRADARAGRVQWLDVEAGIARGDVLDADGALYRARVDLPAFRASDRDVFLQVARARPELPARLASGIYPQEVEGELAPYEVSLLPRGASELSHDCSCLDWPGPCRHVAALVYVLVEAVDEHPVHLLSLRGLTLEDLVAPVQPAAVCTTSRADSSGESESSGEGRDTGGGRDARGGRNSGGADDPDALSAPAAASPTTYDPTRTNPDLLIEVIGAGPARIIAEFFGSQGSPGDAEPVEVSGTGPSTGTGTAPSTGTGTGTQPAPPASPPPPDNLE